MEEESTRLYFYPSKVKSILVIIFCLVFLVASVAMCYVLFKDEEYFLSLICGGAAIFLVFGIPIIIIRIVKSIPILILTKQELIINPETKNPIPIKWEDIERCQIRDVYIKHNTLTFLEIILYDEEKYTTQLSNIKQTLNLIGTMDGEYSPFSIYLKQIKSTERNLLFYALDNITSPDFDVENVPESNETKKMDRFMKRVNAYFIKSYSMSLIVTILFLLLLYSAQDEMGLLNYVILSFVLFPFAKFILDFMFLFDLKSNIENKSDVMKPVFQIIYPIIYFFLYFISPVIGPIGLLYFITRMIYRWVTKKKNKSCKADSE